MNQEIPSRFIMNPEKINFILHRRRGSVPVKIYSNQDSSYTFPDRPPMFKGGKKVLKILWINTFHYPTDAWQHDITGMISVSMKIDTMGHLSSYHLINRVYPIVGCTSFKDMQDHTGYLDSGFSTRVKSGSRSIF